MFMSMSMSVRVHPRGHACARQVAALKKAGERPKVTYNASAAAEGSGGGGGAGERPPTPPRVSIAQQNAEARRDTAFPSPTVRTACACGCMRISHAGVACACVHGMRVQARRKAEEAYLEAKKKFGRKRPWRPPGLILY